MARLRDLGFVGLLFAALEAGAATTLEMTVTPIQFSDPHAVNPDVVTVLGTKVGYANTVFQRWGHFTTDGSFTSFPIPLPAGEKFQARNATSTGDGNTIVFIAEIILPSSHSCNFTVSRAWRTSSIFLASWS